MIGFECVAEVFVDSNGPWKVPFLHEQSMIAVIAILEIIHHGVWNFFRRLENEHLNNVGKYRAFKSVPLPYNYTETMKRKTNKFYKLVHCEDCRVYAYQVLQVQCIYLAICSTVFCGHVFYASHS